MTRINANQPIGIFDSGIGGLTVANAITRYLPNENIIYFGDTAHLPYGDKSAEAIKHYAVKITDFLLQKECKIIVIACNTASSVAFHEVQKHVKKRTLVANVIDPIVDYVVDHNSHNKIGVIGTKGTIKSRIYAKKIQRRNKTISVTQLATPLLAPMIEEGFFNNYISRTIIHSYLSKSSLKNIEALILGCTHYPLIKKEIVEYYLNKVEIIDSAEIVAQKVKEQLQQHNLIHSKNKPLHHFYVSDYTQAFEKSTRFFFKDKIHLEKATIWE